VATTAGFALPRFAWQVNGRQLTWASDSVTVPAKVSIDDPNHPDVPRSATEQFSFSYSHHDEFSFAGLANRLVINNSSFSGRYTLDIQVSVQDQYGPAGKTGAATNAFVDTAAVVYEQRYYDDQRRCAAVLRKAVESHTRGMAKAMDLVRTLPDPPPPAVVRALLEALGAVRDELRDGHVSLESARDAVHLVARELGIPVDIAAHALNIQLSGGAAPSVVTGD